jgi:O-antigen ligase
MTERWPKILLPLSLVIVSLYAFYVVIAGAVSSNAYMYLGGLIGLEILIMVVWKYRERYFTVLVITFLCAGTGVPFRSVFLTARWGVLAVGALVGFSLYMKSPIQKFGTFHLVAAFSIITALVSALVSNYPSIALLKTVSLFLVFLYAAAGARLAVVGREANFFSGLLLGCEIIVYISAFCYLVLHYPFYGNSNSLGVVMGVVAFPLLFWGVIASAGTRLQRRLIFALVLCGLLLLSSYARAAIGGAGISSAVLCIALRRYRLMLKGLAAVVLAALLVITIAPLAEAPSGGGLMERLSLTFFYKGKRELGVFSSRESPWTLTSKAIHQHPWFGTGFGTSETSDEAHQQDLTVQSIRGATREHGNSYLAIAEWTGLFGVAPFYFLVILLVFNVGQVVRWIRRTGSPFSPAVPVAAVLIAGLFHATFEDWLFAVGYYMCSFFWALAFVLFDVLPATDPLPAPAEALPARNPAFRDFSRV